MLRICFRGGGLQLTIMESPTVCLVWLILGSYWGVLFKDINTEKCQERRRLPYTPHIHICTERMNFPSCCVIDDIHHCKGTVLSDFGTGLGLWMLFALLWLHSKDQGDILRTRAVEWDAKPGWAVWAHETKRRFNWGHNLNRVLLAVDDCVWLRHPLPAFPSTIPGFGALWQEA